MTRASLLAERIVRMDGGPGSGNFGHKGRKGQRGGSAPAGSSSESSQSSAKKSSLNSSTPSSKIKKWDDTAQKAMNSNMVECKKQIKSVLSEMGVGDAICVNAGPIKSIYVKEGDDDFTQYSQEHPTSSYNPETDTLGWYTSGESQGDEYVAQMASQISKYGTLKNMTSMVTGEPVYDCSISVTNNVKDITDNATISLRVRGKGLVSSKYSEVKDTPVVTKKREKSMQKRKR